MMSLFKRKPAKLIELPYNMALAFGDPQNWPSPGARGPGGIVYVRNRRWLANDRDGYLTYLEHRLYANTRHRKPQPHGAFALRPEEV